MLDSTTMKKTIAWKGGKAGTPLKQTTNRADKHTCEMKTPKEQGTDANVTRLALKCTLTTKYLTTLRVYACACACETFGLFPHHKTSFIFLHCLYCFNLYFTIQS